MKKQLPKLRTDEDVERLLETDLSGYLTAENLSALSDRDLDFSEIRESTHEELIAAKRIGRPVTGLADRPADHGAGKTK